MKVLAKISAKTRPSLVPHIRAFAENGANQKPAKIQIKFALKQRIQYGSHFTVVGSNSTFGKWKPEQGVNLSWNEGDVWTSEVEVPIEDALELKFVIVDKDEVLWQPGENIVLQVPEDVSELVVETDDFYSDKVHVKPVTSGSAQTKTASIAEEAKKTQKDVSAAKIVEKAVIDTSTASVAGAPAVSNNGISAKVTTPVATAKSASAMVDFDKLKVPELKEKLAALGLKTSGKKAELIQRLTEAHDKLN